MMPAGRGVFNSTVACPAFGASRPTHASVEQIPIRLLSFDIHSSLDRDRPVAPGLIDVSKIATSPNSALVAGRHERVTPDIASGISLRDDAATS